MSSGAGSVRNGPARLVNPLSANLVSKLSISTDITKRTMPVTCVASLTTPGQPRRTKADRWKPINPPDPNDKDYDRSNVKMRVDDKRVLRPNLSDDSDEEDDVSDYDGSDESDLTGDGEEDLSEGDTDSLVKSPRSDEEDGSETESPSDGENSDSSSGSDIDEGDSPRRRSRSLRRDCASDDDVDDIWEISDDVLKITESAVLNKSDEVLKISESGEAHGEDDSKIQEKIKSEKEDLLIFGRIREPKCATTTPTKGKQQFPRGTKKFNPCHIDRNIHRNIAHPQNRAGPQNKSYSASHRCGKNTKTSRQGNSNRQPPGQVDGQRGQEKIGETPNPTTDTKTNLSCEHKLISSPEIPFIPAPTLPSNQGYLCANQNNNKPVTYADVCRRNPLQTSPAKPYVNTAAPPSKTTGKYSPTAALHTISSPSSKKSHSDSELEPKITESPQKLSSSSTTVELSKARDEDPSNVPVVAKDSESTKSTVPPEIRDQDPAILSVSTSPPHCPTLVECPPSECPSPVPLLNSPFHGAPLFPPQYMTYANPYAYSNYLFSILNQLSPQDMLMIFYELKMLEAMNATLIQSPVPNTF